MENQASKDGIAMPGGRRLAMAVAICGLLDGGTALAAGTCTSTANLMSMACSADATDNYRVAQARCLNFTDRREKTDCQAEVTAEYGDDRALCADQLDAREDVCDALGEAPYDPDFDEEDFETDFRNLANPNPYFPLEIGNTWDYGGTEQVKVQVLNKTKRIDDVTCVVSRDTVTVDGKVQEDTLDWFAQALDGNTWYCGEEVKDYETFAGDAPREAELVSIDGSFKVDRDGAKPGIIFPAVPQLGQTYREEFALGNAEDIATIKSINYRYGSNRELDRFVPRALVERFCRAGDCVVTENYTPIEPGPEHLERKYYARGVGFFLQTRPSEAGVDVQLVNCNFDARCAGLPAP